MFRSPWYAFLLYMGMPFISPNLNSLLQLGTVPEIWSIGNPSPARTAITRESSGHCAGFTGGPCVPQAARSWCFKRGWGSAHHTRGQDSARENAPPNWPSPKQRYGMFVFWYYCERLYNVIYWQYVIMYCTVVYVYRYLEMISIFRKVSRLVWRISRGPQAARHQNGWHSTEVSDPAWVPW